MINEYQKWLIEWFARKDQKIILSPEDNYFIAGAIDSLGVIELIEAMEETFSIRFAQSDFQDPRFVSIQGLAEIILEKSTL
jgi:acyl carrier protein